MCLRSSGGLLRPSAPVASCASVPRVVLSAFLEKSAELESLRYLPQFFTWLSLLMERYDKRLAPPTWR